MKIKIILNTNMHVLQYYFKMYTTCFSINCIKSPIVEKNTQNTKIIYGSITLSKIVYIFVNIYKIYTYIYYQHCFDFFFNNN